MPEEPVFAGQELVYRCVRRSGMTSLAPLVGGLSQAGALDRLAPVLASDSGLPKPGCVTAPDTSPQPSTAPGSDREALLRMWAFCMMMV